MKSKNRTSDRKSYSLESQSNSKSSVTAATITIVVLHLALLFGFVSQGCKKEDYAGNGNNDLTSTNDSMGTLDDHKSFAPIPNDQNANSLLTGTNAGNSTNLNTNSQATPNTGETNSGLPSLPENVTTNNVIDPENENGLTITNVANPEVGFEHTYNGNEITTTNTAPVNPPNNETEVNASKIVKVTIKKGDTIGRIATLYRTDVQSIVALNPEKLKDLNKVQINWVIDVPDMRNTSTSDENETTDTNSSSEKETNSEYEVYTVVKGDNLSIIGRKYGVRWQDIQKLNKLPSSSIRPGQELLIPNKE